MPMNAGPDRRSLFRRPRRPDLCYGMDQVKPVIFKALVDELKAMGVTIRGIYERNDVKVRELDGMEQYKGWYEADFLPEPGSVITTIEENGIRYDIDVENGQKTGFFLDQKYNRLAVAKIAAGKHVLDCFTHTGAFASMPPRAVRPVSPPSTCLKKPST